MFREGVKIGKVDLELEEPRTDDLFLCFSSFEERCLGTVRAFNSRYRAKYSRILHIIDEKSKLREIHYKELHKKLGSVSQVEKIETTHRDPFFGIRTLNGFLHKHIMGKGEAQITVDITTFPKKQLLLLLNLLNMTNLLHSVRLLYTEPINYAAQEGKPLSFGVKDISVIPTFRALYRPQKKLILILLLGYEGDRSLALWENIEPHETIAVLPNPSYKEEWNGTTEKMNAALLASLEDSNIYHIDARDPMQTKKLLADIIMANGKDEYANWYIAPIGTKLQMLGVFLFWLKHPGIASIVYAGPLKHAEEYYSTGIGDTWEISFC